VDVNVVVEDVFRMLSRLLGRDIRLQRRLHPGVAQVRAERGQVEQVLSNLVLNARDALPAGGTITVATRVDPARGEVVLSVIDTGRGMDDITRRRIFEPFFTTKVPGRGTGLGLSTVALIAELLGGRVVVKSTLGIGTTIDVILPHARRERSG
jgi:signal transduction histidine kinase